MFSFFSYLYKWCDPGVVVTQLLRILCTGFGDEISRLEHDSCQIQSKTYRIVALNSECPQMLLPRAYEYMYQNSIQSLPCWGKKDLGMAWNFPEVSNGVLFSTSSNTFIFSSCVLQVPPTASLEPVTELESRGNSWVWQPSFSCLQEGRDGVWTFFVFLLEPGQYLFNKYWLWF